jgi:hypothetical protein
MMLSDEFDVLRVRGLGVHLDEPITERTLIRNLIEERDAARHEAWRWREAYKRKKVRAHRWVAEDLAAVGIGASVGTLIALSVASWVIANWTVIQ